ncbi:MAG: PAS domain-containing protein [Bacteroidales bacterium]|nr:PAS domain-containing protein [Bacteroidales bacterium]
MEAEFMNSETEMLKIFEGNEVFFATFMSEIQDGVYILKNETIVYLNDRIEYIFGYSKEEFRKSAGLDLVSPEDRLILEKANSGDLQYLDISQGYEYWIIRQDGGRRCLYTRFFDFSKSESKNIMVLISDITDLRLVESEAQAGEDRYRVISELVSDYAYSFKVEPDGSFVAEWLTEAFTRITGFSTPEEIDSFGGLLSLIHMEDLTKMTSHDKDLLSGKPIVSEFRILTKSGDVRWIRDYSLPTWDETEKRVTRLYGAAQDISEMKLAEDALKTSEERNNAILEAFPDWVFRISPKGIILDFSGGGDDYNNLDFDYKGSLISESFLSDASELILSKIFDVLFVKSKKDGKETGQVESTVKFDFDVPFLDEIRHFEASLVKSSEVDVLMFLHDVSERARLEKMKSDFINRASHELRTPLTGAILMSDLIQEGGDEGEMQEYWMHLRSELDRQRSLIERLLTVGRLETGSLRLSPVPMDIRETIEEACSAVFSMANQNNVIIKTELLEKMPLVNGDRTGLEQVLINLINNAVKFSPLGGEVLIRTTQDEQNLIIVVADQGVGIPDSDIPHLFGGFFRARNAVEQGIPGSGVGLYIVKSIIEELRGTVGVESKIGVGTKFLITLPVLN